MFWVYSFNLLNLWSWLSIMSADHSLIPIHSLSPLLPQCFNASTRNQYDGSNWCFNVLCLTSAMARNMIREGYGIEGGCCSDILTSCYCGPCSAIQLRQEVVARGAVSTGKSTANKNPDRVELIQPKVAAAASAVSAGNWIRPEWTGKYLEVIHTDWWSQYDVMMSVYI